MKYSIVLLVFILTTIVGCRKDDDGLKSEAGYFKLTEIRDQGLKNTRLYMEDSVKTEFMLGDLKSSREFYFLLSNGGENPVFNVELKIDNPQFNITPENISILPGKNTSAEAAFVPLISLGIIHGMRLNGVGFESLLPMDENSATLTITGKTLENGDTLDLRSDFIFMVNAKKMDIRLFENENEINLLQPSGNAMFPNNYGGLGTLRYYNLVSKTFAIQNTGNVDLDIKVIELSDYDGTVSNLTDTVVLQNQSVNFNVIQSHVVISMDSQGTVCDYARIKQGEDGKGYLALLIYSN